MHSYAPSADCPRFVRPDILRRPRFVRDVSAICPLYPTRPDPTRIYLPQFCLWLFGASFQMLLKTVPREVRAA